MEDQDVSLVMEPPDGDSLHSIFEYDLPTSPSVPDIIPNTTLQLWRENLVKSSSHSFVANSVYIPSCRKILEEHNPYCIWSAINCRLLVRSNGFDTRFYCRNPACRIKAKMIISASGSVDLKFHEEGGCSDNLPSITVHHVNDKSRTSYIRDFERRQIQAASGTLTPQQQYVQKNATLSKAQIEAGKGVTSRRVLKEIGKEKRRNQARDPNVLNALNLMAHESDSFIKLWLVIPHVQIVTFESSHLGYLSLLQRICTFGLDGTVVQTTNALGFRKLEMYNLVIENPIMNEKPIPLASAHLSCQKKEDIATFLETFCKEVPAPFHPLVITVDKSWAIIRAILIVCNKMDVWEFLREMFQIMVEGSPVKKSFTLIVICLFHYLLAVKRFLHGHHLSAQKEIFFKMLAIALQSQLTWDSVMSLSYSMFVVCDSKKLTPRVSKAKDNIFAAIKNVRSKNAALSFDAVPLVETLDSEQVVEEEHPSDGSEKTPLANSPFRKPLQELRQKVSDESIAGDDLPDNDLYFPSFASYQVDNWLNCPIHLEGVHQIVGDEKAKAAIPGFRPPNYKNSTNNISEKNNQLFKQFLGDNPLRLDALIEQHQMYMQSAQNDFLKSGLPLLQKAKARKRKLPVAEIDRPEIFKKHKKAKLQMEENYISGVCPASEPPVNFQSTSNQFLFENSCNACAIMSVAKLFCNSHVMNSKLISFLEAGTIDSPFLSQLFQCYLSNAYNTELGKESLVLPSEIVSHLKDCYISEVAPEDRNEQMHSTEKLISYLYGAPIFVSQSFTCNGCLSKAVTEDAMPWFTITAHPSADVTTCIMSANAPCIINNYDCGSCQVSGVSATVVKSFCLVPNSFLVKVGRESVSVGSGVHRLTRLDQVPINISPSINVKMGDKDVQYDLLSCVAFQGHDNLGHFLS